MSTNKITKELTIPLEYQHERLDQTLANLLPEYSRTQIKLWIESGAILVDGQISKPKNKVRGEEQISIHAELKEQPVWQPQNIELNIVHEDESVLIINKPAGLVVHPGAGNPDSTLLNALLHYSPELKNLPRAGILHRLDKGTTGLLIIAKTLPAHKFLSEQMKNHHISREYQAIVVGRMISGGTVDEPMARHPIDRKRMTIDETGKPAITHYRVAEKYRAHTRLKIKLETGRTHQIRVHMAHIRHPIVGDKVYGGRLQLAKGTIETLKQQLRKFDRQALHAYAIEFTHPQTQTLERFEIALPLDMQELIEALNKDKNEVYRT